MSEALIKATPLLKWVYALPDYFMSSFDEPINDEGALVGSCSFSNSTGPRHH